MSYRLDEAFALNPRDDGRGFHRDDCDPAWNIGGRFINGGYLQGINAAAVGETIDASRDLIAVSTVFSSQVVPGPFEIDVEVAKLGRRISSGTARLRQDDAACVTSLVTLGVLPTDPGASGVVLQMPAVPSIDDCEPLRGAAAVSGLADVVDLRLVPGSELAPGMPSRNELLLWVRFRDERPLDSLALIAFSDIGPPLCFAQGNFGWAPTLQMQVTSYCKPVGNAVLMRVSGSPYGAGMFGCEEVDLWDVRGVLVARGRQMAMLPQSADQHGKSGH